MIRFGQEGKQIKVSNVNRADGHSHTSFNLADIANVKGIAAMGVRSVFIHNGQYNVHEASADGLFDNSEMRWTDGTDTWSINPPAGNYTFAQLTSEVASSGNPNPSSSDTNDPTDVTLTQDANTGLVTAVLNSATDYGATITSADTLANNPRAWDILYDLGFDIGTSFARAGAGPYTYTATATRVPNIGYPTRYWHIVVEGIPPKPFVVAGSASGQLDATLLALPVLAGFQDMEVWHTDNPTMHWFEKEVETSQLRFKLKRDDGYTCDLNGAEWDVVFDVVVRK